MKGGAKNKPRPPLDIPFKLEIDHQIKIKVCRNLRFISASEFSA